MIHAHTLRLALHASALVLEAVGSGLVLLDTIRLNEMVAILGYASFDGGPERLKAWYFHCAVLGFVLLFVGMLFAAVVLWVEHAAHVRSTIPKQAGRGSGTESPKEAQAADEPPSEAAQQPTGNQSK